MGSLMAGWNSPITDPKSVRYQRNWSLTRGEIEAYWSSKKKTEEEHLRAICGSLDISQDDTPEESGRRVLQRSTSLPLSNTKENFMDISTETSFEKLIKKNGWWTWSNSAFLNEPPVLASEGPPNTYGPQIHVASFASPEHN
ncbi:hypothetical protein L1049_026212 [Liquidambar formosana]|uniref:Uncharacterized protein n=1 Tax=Liquidambar formosana TaxID=63359 RepID=A0AAP0R682_LIQFO